MTTRLGQKISVFRFAICLLGFAIAFPLAASLSANAADTTLNDAYQQALRSKFVTPDFLKWTELHWITYRDAEADLQARLAGKTAPDETARAAVLLQATTIRIAELQHLAQDGCSGDLKASTSASSRSDVESAYAALRQAVLAKGDPQLVAAVIADQKAWASFANLQSDYDGFRPHAFNPQQKELRSWSLHRMDGPRVAQLQADLAALGASASAAATIPPAGDDAWTEISADKSIRIEQAGQIWVISNQTGAREVLPETDDVIGTGERGKPTVSISEYSISPDDEWIFRTQKFYHGMNGAYLYHRVNGLKYAFATKTPFDVLAWKFFHAATGQNPDMFFESGVVRLGQWGPGTLRISLNAAKRLTDLDVNDWIVEYDLKSDKFSVPPDQLEHDRQAYTTPAK